MLFLSCMHIKGKVQKICISKTPFLVPYPPKFRIHFIHILKICLIHVTLERTFSLKSPIALTEDWVMSVKGFCHVLSPYHYAASSTRTISIVKITTENYPSLQVILCQLFLVFHSNTPYPSSV